MNKLNKKFTNHDILKSNPRTFSPKTIEKKKAIITSVIKKKSTFTFTFPTRTFDFKKIETRQEILNYLNQRTMSSSSITTLSDLLDKIIDLSFQSYSFMPKEAKKELKKLTASLLFVFGNKLKNQLDLKSLNLIEEVAKEEYLGNKKKTPEATFAKNLLNGTYETIFFILGRKQQNVKWILPYLEENLFQIEKSEENNKKSALAGYVFQHLNQTHKKLIKEKILLGMEIVKKRFTKLQKLLIQKGIFKKAQPINSTFFALE